MLFSTVMVGRSFWTLLLARAPLDGLSSLLTRRGMASVIVMMGRYCWIALSITNITWNQRPSQVQGHSERSCEESRRKTIRKLFLFHCCFVCADDFYYIALLRPLTTQDWRIDWDSECRQAYASVSRDLASVACCIWYLCSRLQAQVQPIMWSLLHIDLSIVPDFR